jgi:hypothetical protein
MVEVPVLVVDVAAADVLVAGADVEVIVLASLPMTVKISSLLYSVGFTPNYGGTTGTNSSASSSARTPIVHLSNSPSRWSRNPRRQRQRSDQSEPSNLS